MAQEKRKLLEFANSANAASKESQERFALMRSQSVIGRSALVKKVSEDARDDQDLLLKSNQQDK